MINCWTHIYSAAAPGYFASKIKRKQSRVWLMQEHKLLCMTHLVTQSCPPALLTQLYTSVMAWGWALQGRRPRPAQTKSRDFVCMCVNICVCGCRRALHAWITDPNYLTLWHLGRVKMENALHLYQWMFLQLNNFSFIWEKYNLNLTCITIALILLFLKSLGTYILRDIYLKILILLFCQGFLGHY